MTPPRVPQQQRRSRLPLMVAATAALPAVMFSSLAPAQPAQAQSPARPLPASLQAAIKAQAAGATSNIPASAVSAALPKTLLPKAPSVPVDYTVVRGDTVSAIAAEFGLVTAEVLALNNLSPNSIIYPGQKIKLTGHPGSPATAAVPAAPAPAGAASYTVRAGDTLSGIAARHGVSLSDVLAWNQLSPTKFIYPGQQIKLAGQQEASTPATPAPAPVTPAQAPAAPSGPASVPATPALAPASSVTSGYTVQAGDTLSGIAARHQVSVSDLLGWNQLTPTQIIYPGQLIRLSGQAGAAPAIAPLQTTPHVVPLVPDTFLGFEYPAAVVSSANANKALLNASPVPTPAEMRSIVADTARSMGVDPALALAFAFQESSFNHRSVSPANAIGTMQVIPSSGEWASDIVGRPLNLLDPHDNVTAGVAIIGKLLETSSSLENAIAGYYQGQYSVSTNGMYDDTKAYVASILTHRQNFQ